MKSILKNWKTTLAGLGVLLGGVATFAAGHTEQGVTAIIAGIGLILSHDGTTPPANP